MPKKKPTFSLKDQLFNRERVQYLAELFASAGPKFDAKGFARDCVKPLEKLELKERITHIAVVLKNYLSSDYRLAAKHIVNALPPPLDPTRTDDDFGDFIFAPLGEYVVHNGLAAKHLKLSLRTLKELTQRFSMEDAIRALINEHTEATLRELERWSVDKNYHVRRLVSEGTRPNLPWSKRIEIDVSTPLPLLDNLHADRTRYVVRSVANHLNDIAKIRPELVIEKLGQWKEGGKQAPKEFDWMSRHALRTLVKQGDRKALKFLGYASKPRVEIEDLTLSPSQVRPGEAFELSLTLEAQRNESLIVDYVVHFVKANGKTSPKVHKLKQLELKKGQRVTIRKRHVLRANATTYTLYPGRHHVTLQINGRPLEAGAFELV